MARIAARLVRARAWERLSLARLSDYAVERLGLSARQAQSLARVGDGLRARPALERALVSGRLGGTRVRLLAGLPPEEDEAHWIGYARGVTAEALSKAVRAVDRGSVESGAADRPMARSRVFEVSCRPEVLWKWHRTRTSAARAAGRMLHVAEAAELIAAEVLSALPVEGSSGAEEPDACEEVGAAWSDAEDSRADGAGPEGGTGGGERTEVEEPSPSELYEAHGVTPLLAGLDEADDFELDARLRRALALEQRLDARIGGLLARVWERWVHRALGYRTREAYARDRLGMDPTRARALVRLERAAVLSAPFARAYRTGALSWVKAGELVPLVTSDSLGRFVEAWVRWAERVTARRLREDVEWALTLQQTDPGTFWKTGGLPAEACGGGGCGSERDAPGLSGADDREIGAFHRDWRRDVSGGRAVDGSPHGVDAGDGRDLARADREIGAYHRPPGADISDPAPRGGTGSARAETCTVRFIGPADVVQLFGAVLCTVRRCLERDAGRLPSPGEALDAMLDHALSSWGADARVPARHRVFARDGWRCAAPGCSSMRNLHDHHVRFRSAGGSDAPANRITLCAFHHLRGIHAEMLRCVGRAPDGLTWQMGIRPGLTPLLVYRSGDVRIGGAGGPS